MDSTSVSLLKRVQRSDDQHAWQRFVDLYAPMIFHWGQKKGLSQSDAADLVQEVLLVLVNKIGYFKHDATRSFRGWLKTIAINKATDIHRRNQVRASENVANRCLDETMAEFAADDVFEGAEYRSMLVARALQIMKAEFSERDWQACWFQVVDGRKAAEIAKEFDVSINVVLLAKSRILARLRAELAGLFD